MKSSFLGKQFSGVGFLLILLCLPCAQYGESNSTGLPEIKKAGDGVYRFGEVLIDRKGKKNQFACRFESGERVDRIWRGS